MRRIITAAALAAALTGLTGCGAAKADSAACESAMRAQLATAITTPDAPAGTKPTACNGVSDAELERIGTAALSNTGSEQ